MRLLKGFVLAIGVALVMPTTPSAAPQMQDQDRVVPGGGIFAPGWMGVVPDVNSIRAGHTIKDSKLTTENGAIVINSGPAGIYWHTANMATGDYTISATFKEPSYMSSNTHDHPYGIFIGGNKLDTEQHSFLYCSAYGDGRYIVRLFGPTVVNLNARGTPSDAVHKAAAKGDAVTQDIAVSVKGGRVECSINGTMVAGFDKAEVVGPGKLDSTDGLYGIRVSHNLDVVVSNLKKQ